MCLVSPAPQESLEFQQSIECLLQLVKEACLAKSAGRPHLIGCVRVR